MSNSFYPGRESNFPERLRYAIGSESVRSVAARAGLADGTVRRYLAGDTDPSRDSLVKLAHALRVTIEWLAAGEGPARHDEQQEEEKLRDERTEKEIDEIYSYIDNCEVPIILDQLPPDHESAKAKAALEKISLNTSINDSCRARADMLLRLAYEDKHAEERSRSRETDVKKRIREASDACEEAMAAVGWDNPPILVREAFLSAIFIYGLKQEAAVFMLRWIRAWGESLTNSTSTTSLASKQ